MTRRPRQVVTVDIQRQTQAFGSRLRQRRQELGLKQREVAADRYTTAYISALETGRVAPSFSSLIHLSEQLKLSPAQLLEEPKLDIERMRAAMHKVRWCKLEALHAFVHGEDPEDDRDREHFRLAWQDPSTDD